MNRFFLFLVYLVFLTTPLESVEIITNFSIVKLVSLLLIGYTLLARKNIFVIREPFLIILMIYAIFTFLSFLWSINQVVTIQKSLLTVLPNFIVTLIVYYAVKDRADLEKMFMAYVVGCVIISFASLYAYATGYNLTEEDEGRITAFNQDQNELSFLLSFGIVSILYLLNYSILKKAVKALLIVLGVVFAFVILTTGSRMGLILLVLIAVTVAFMNIRKGRIVFFVPVILVVGLTLFEFLPDTTRERLFQIQDQVKSRDLTGRVAIWKLGFNAFEKKNAYVLGTGYNTFRSLITEKSGLSAASHNTYLSVLVELGVAGFCIYLIMIAYLLFRIYYLFRKGSVFFILLILPLLVTMFALSTNDRRWFFLIGVIIVKLWQFAKDETFVDKLPAEEYIISEDEISSDQAEISKIIPVK
jgi:O-antigen ligase